MRKTIPPDAAPDRPPFVVEADGRSGLVMLEADGHPAWFTPAEARRIARALFQAASVVERAARGQDVGPDE